MPFASSSDHSTDKDSGRQVMKNRRKLSSQAGPRNIRIAVLGQDGVGKTGMTAAKVEVKRFN